jgi:hypothetical protein
MKDRGDAHRQDRVTLELTTDGYHAELKKLGLRPSGSNSTETHDFYLTRDHLLQSVMKPELQTPAQRRETIDRLKRLLGVGVFRG